MLYPNKISHRYPFLSFKILRGGAGADGGGGPRWQGRGGAAAAAAPAAAAQRRAGAGAEHQREQRWHHGCPAPARRLVLQRACHCPCLVSSSRAML